MFKDVFKLFITNQNTLNPQNDMSNTFTLKSECDELKRLKFNLETQVSKNQLSLEDLKGKLAISK